MNGLKIIAFVFVVLVAYLAIIPTTVVVDAAESSSEVSLAEEEQATEASADFQVYSMARVKSNNDTISSGLQLVYYEYGLGVYNINDMSDTVLGDLEYTLQADNIVDVDDAEYADWNESYVKWVFPPDYFLVEDDSLWIEAETRPFETKYMPMSISRWMNKSVFDSDGYQQAEFYFTLDEMNFDNLDYCSVCVEVEENSLVDASFVPDSFSTDAPLRSFDPFRKKDEHEINLFLDTSQLQANKTYTFSVVVRVYLKGDSSYPILYKPYYKITLGFDTRFVKGQTGKTLTVPSELLREHIHYASASTNVSNAWKIGPGNELITKLEEVSEPMGPTSTAEGRKGGRKSPSGDDSEGTITIITTTFTEFIESITKSESMQSILKSISKQKAVLLVSLIALIALVAVGYWYMRRRKEGGDRNE